MDFTPILFACVILYGLIFVLPTLGVFSMCDNHLNDTHLCKILKDDHFLPISNFQTVFRRLSKFLNSWFILFSAKQMSKVKIWILCPVQLPYWVRSSALSLVAVEPTQRWESVIRCQTCLPTRPLKTSIHAGVTCYNWMGLSTFLSGLIWSYSGRMCLV